MGSFKRRLREPGSVEPLSHSAEMRSSFSCGRRDAGGRRAQQPSATSRLRKPLQRDAHGRSPDSGVEPRKATSPHHHLTMEEP